MHLCISVTRRPPRACTEATKNRIYGLKCDSDSSSASWSMVYGVLQVKTAVCLPLVCTPSGVLKDNLTVGGVTMSSVCPRSSGEKARAKVPSPDTNEAVR